MTFETPRLMVDEIGMTFVRHGNLVLTSELSPIWRIAHGKVAAAGLRATTIVDVAQPSSAAGPAGDRGLQSGSLSDRLLLAMHIRNFAHALQFLGEEGLRLFVAAGPTEDGGAEFAGREAVAEGIDPERIVAEFGAGGVYLEERAAAFIRAGFTLSLTGLGPDDAGGASVSATLPGVVRFDRDWLMGALSHRHAAPLLLPLLDSIRTSGMEPHVAGLASAAELQAVGRLGSLLVEGTGFDDAGELEGMLREGSAKNAVATGAKVINLLR